MLIIKRIRPSKNITEICLIVIIISAISLGNEKNSKDKLYTTWAYPMLNGSIERVSRYIKISEDKKIFKKFPCKISGLTK